TTQSLDLTEWRHVATQARDHYVRVVYDGFLYPFGHRASLVKVTERKVVPPDGGVVTSPTAYLKQHMYIVVREQEKTYVSAPDIDMPSYSSETPGPSASFWVDVGGNGFPFHLTAVDLAGQRISFLAQLIFMSVREPRLEAVQTEYRATPDRRPCVVRGQKIAY